MGNITVIAAGQDQSVKDAIRDIIRKKNWQFEELADVDESLERLCRGGVSLAVLHIASARDGIEVARFLSISDVPVLVINDMPDADVRLSFLRLGAVECLSRPFDVNRLRMLVDITTARECVSPRSSRAASGPAKPADSSEWESIGWRAPCMRSLSREIQLVSPLDTTVLITGETGTGKTRLAQFVHNRSPRRDQPFVTMNCGTVSETLLASELFGHVRGSFTGADRDHVGKLAQARGGTLFLDDVDLLRAESQARFLRAVEERVYEPVGSHDSKEVKARFIVATNRSLEDQMRAGRFRSDLYYRLNVVSFHLPPLRERVEDIPHLASEFVAEFCSRHKLPAVPLTPDAIAVLQEHSWPGNIRELRNAIERTVIMSRGEPIQPDALPEAIRRMDGFATNPAESEFPRNRLDDARRNAERRQLVAILRQFDNNRTRAASELGISRAALYKKLRQLGLD